HLTGSRTLNGSPFTNNGMLSLGGTLTGSFTVPGRAAWAGALAGSGTVVFASGSTVTVSGGCDAAESGSVRVVNNGLLIFPDQSALCMNDSTVLTNAGTMDVRG